MNLEKLLLTLVKENVSDVHFKVGRPPMVRILGDLVPTKYQKLLPEHTRFIMKKILNEPLQKRLEAGYAVDISYEIPKFRRFRINVFQTMGNLEIVMRVVPLEIPKFEDLFLPPVLTKVCEEHRGMVLVTGIAGCGKSTTLAAMIDFINQRRRCHIITIEDPIEFTYEDHLANVNQVEVGVDAESFARALRSSLRQDPDVMLVGEMRDVATIDTAIKAAETGHLVFSTLHTLNAVETINRIIDSFEPHQQQQVRFQLAANLKAIISQRLLTKKDRSGRIPAVEILISTVTIQAYIIDPEKTKSIRDVIIAGRDQYGMQTIDQHLTDLYKGEVIDFDTAISAATNPHDFERALQFV
ncbi:MAG: hypothetical protein A2161_15890 [Candidatus Schekmanbacteria bacterium RBG_13_48_7]|uniref:Bacterial type II secretion system protein E domain-containing protein n=1 Tax=Candidatus Schekmanbacteria bacterium RBG_13_48_7 TaxID=1817878 RepID=A0A1F7RPA6_9BACT|nr:MAG: hypothetical protein A2161_15890 [Candidatus Schekmanbacteria bacterium RBG_13_48_7]